MIKDAVTIVAMICITIITGLALASGEGVPVIVSALSVLGGLGGYFARQSSNNRKV